MSSKIPNRPPFDSLPLHESDPPFSAWGLYGKDDQLGTLNILTPENTLAAARSEIKTGVRVSLDPPIGILGHHTLGARKKFTQTLIRRLPERPSHDDVVEFNTQVGAQWDGFRHVTYLKRKEFYNGVHMDVISGPNADPFILGTQHWVENGCIAGRGVLLDYYSYAQAKGKHYKLIGKGADYAITVEELEDVAKYQGVEIKYGDLLFVRSGLWVGFNKLSEEEKREWSVAQQFEWVGVETHKKTLKWLWDSGIVACAGDAPGWERVPTFNSPPEAGIHGMGLHEVMLGGWAMPIGEMFDLEGLSWECQRQKRWSFFVTSVPLHVPGGVGSPPNCLAIF